jgi:hypothetical protein
MMRRAQARARIAIATATIAALQGKRNHHAITRLHHRHLPQLGRDGQQQRLKKSASVHVQSRVCDGKRQRRLPNSSGGTKRNCIYLQGRGAAGGGARHCGAPMLRRYAMTSALLFSMAYLSAVLPLLQGR